MAPPPLPVAAPGCATTPSPVPVPVLAPAPAPAPPVLPPPLLVTAGPGWSGEADLPMTTSGTRRIRLGPRLEGLQDRLGAAFGALPVFGSTRISRMPGGMRNGVGRPLCQRLRHEIAEDRRRDGAAGLLLAERARLSKPT